MNFGSSFATQTKIKKEECEVIDLDLDTTSEDLVFEWNTKVRLKLNNHFIVESEQNLDLIMKRYIRSLKDEVVNFEDYDTLKKFTKKHLDSFKLSFAELNCCFVDDYLDNMEEILAFYVSLELKSLPTKEKDAKKSSIKKKLSSICNKINSMLNVYLLYNEYRKYHVLMKIKITSHTDESRYLLNLLYGKLLTGRTKDKSDLEFCRAYILYQKWKTFRKPDEWETMDQVMYKLYERTPESIKTNPVLKQILFPQNNSVLDTLIHISEKHLIISEEYFKYIKSKIIHDECLITSEINDIEIQDDDIQFIISDEEDPSYKAASRLYHLEINNRKGKPPEESTVIKLENNASDSEDCQIVDADDSYRLVHELADGDDDDILEMIYIVPKGDVQDVQQKNKTNKETTFLESIELPENGDVSMETVSSSTTNVSCVPVQDSTNNLTEISSTESAESPSSNVEPVPEPAPVETDTNPQTEPTKEEIPPKPPNKKHEVVSIETQTDQTDICRSYYFYGLVTPPSDQLPDEQMPSTAGAATYPNVYANIVRSRSPDESDSLTKATETDSLSSADDNNGKVSVGLSTVEHEALEFTAENVTVENEANEQETIRQEEEIQEKCVESDKTEEARSELRPVSPSQSADGAGCLQEISASPDFVTTSVMEERVETADVTSTSYDFALPPNISTYVSQCRFGEDDYVNDEPYPYDADTYNANEEYEENVARIEAAAKEIYVEKSIVTNNAELYLDEALSVGANVNVSTEESEERHTNAFPLRELKVSVEKIDVSSLESTERVATLDADEFSKFQDKVRGSWGGLNETRELDDMFCGPITKINGTACYPNPDSGFDLFSNGSRPSNSSSELTSPAYEAMEDFRSYYEERKNDVTQEKPNSDNELGVVDLTPTGRSKKRVHIVETFVDSRRSTPQPPTENVLRGILKKSPVSEKRRISRRRVPARLINARSLELYNVDADDSRIQNEPVTVLERLSDSTISQWLHVTEISRKVRMEKQSSHDVSETIRVDYDKQSTSKRDTVWYSTMDGTVKMSVPVPDTFGKWRAGSVAKTRLEEGLQELPYTEKKNGKRKRQSGVTVYSNKTAKRGPVFRKAPVAAVEEVGGRKTTRKRRKLEWD